MTYYTPQTCMSVYGTFTVIGIILTCLRLWVRLSYARVPYPQHALGLDDFFILFGLIAACTCTGLQFNDAIYGLSGEATSAKDQISRQLTQNKADFAMKAIEKIAFGAIKLSLLFFYDRIFGFWPSFRRINITLICIVALWTLSFFLADLFLCGVHPSVQWGLDQKANRKRCGDTGALLIAFAATSVLTDLAVLCLPLMYIRRLQLRRSKKVATSVVFLLGGVSTLAGILRLIWLCIAYPMGRLTWGYTAPPNTKVPLVLQVFNPTFYVMIEMLLGTWAANLPALAPLVKGIRKHLKVNRKLSGSTMVLYGDSTSRKESNSSTLTGPGNSQKKHSLAEDRSRTDSNTTFV